MCCHFFLIFRNKVENTSFHLDFGIPSAFTLTISLQVHGCFRSSCVLATYRFPELPSERRNTPYTQCTTSALKPMKRPILRPFSPHTGPRGAARQPAPCERAGPGEQRTRALTWSQLPGAPGWIAEQSAANSAPFSSSGQLRSVPP